MRHQIFAILAVVSLCALLFSDALGVLAVPWKAKTSAVASKDLAVGLYKLGMTFAQFKSLPLPASKPGSKVALRASKINATAFLCQFFGAEMQPFRPSEPKFTFVGAGDGAKLVRIAADVDSWQLPKVFAELRAKYGQRTILKSPAMGIIAQWDVTPNNRIQVRQTSSALGTVFFFDLTGMERFIQAQAVKQQ